MWAALISLCWSVGCAATGLNGVLVDQFGRAVPASTLRGRVLLVYFGFSHCADLCPNALQTMGLAMKILGRHGDGVLPLFVSVDPAHDSPAVLRSYLAPFDRRILGLTGSPASVEEAARTFAVQFKPAAAGAKGESQIDHSVFIYVADRAGKIVRRFLPAARPDEIAAALRMSLTAPKVP